jgi:hypothetical protein
MFKKIWQSFMRWIRKTFGKGKLGSVDRVATAELPPLDDTDREYLFMQLLEGVAHGWQQPRAVGFFNKIRQRVRKSEWLEWLDRFGNNLLNAPVPNYELAGRMVQLSQLDCGEIGDLAGVYGVRLLERQSSESSGEFLPVLEFDTVEFADAEMDEDHPFGLSYGGSANEIERDWENSIRSNDAESNFASVDPAGETREITLEEFAAMLQKDPALVAELAEQFGIETTDPQVIINAVIAQMQQQVQPISGELNLETLEPTVADSPPVDPLPTELDRAASSETSPIIPDRVVSAPPPPPTPKLEYKSDDPWTQPPTTSEESLPEAVNSPDRGV